MQQNTSTRSVVIVRWGLTACLAIGTVWALWIIRDIVLLVFASVIVAVLIDTPISFLMRRGLNRPLAVLLSSALFIIILGLTFVVIVPGLVEQFVDLAGLLPEGYNRLLELHESGDLYAELPWLETIINELNLDLSSLGPLLEQIFQALQQIPSVFFPVVGGVASVLLNVLILLFMTGYFLATPSLYLNGLLRMAPLAYRTRAREILQRLNLTLEGFLRAKTLSMFIVGVGVFVSMALLGIPLAAALGVLTGLFSFVPNFGPLVALVPTLAVTVVNAPNMWLWSVVVIYGWIFLESQFIGPYLMSEEIALPPVMVLLGQIVAGVFFGFLGLVLAVPLTAIVMVLVQEIYIKDILGDHGEPLPQMEDVSLVESVDGSA